MPTVERISPRSRSGVKIANQWLRQLLSLFHRCRTLSRLEILEATGLNAASLSHALRYLQAQGLVFKTASSDGGSGRRREIYTLNAEAGYFVALDLEGDLLRFGLTNLLGDLRCRWEESLKLHEHLQPERILDGVRKVTRDLDPVQLSRVLALGVSYPGLLDGEGRLSAVNLGWNHFPIKAFLQEAFHWPVFLERDKETCMHAEHWMGAAQGCRNALFLIVEGGIGLGILADGEPLGGARGFSGEIGHCKFLPGAEDRCNCGQTGCLEAIASSVNIVRQYGEQTGAETAGLRFDAVAEQARRGDTAAQAVLQRAARAIGAALAFAINLLDPEVVVLGGDLIHAEDVFLPLLWEQIRSLARPRSLEIVRLAVSVLGLDIRLKGAATLAFGNLLDDPDLLHRICHPVTLSTGNPPFHSPNENISGTLPC